MEENRIKVIGKIDDVHEKHAMDLLMINGRVVVETVDRRTGCRVKTPFDSLIAGCEELKKIQKPNVMI